MPARTMDPSVFSAIDAEFDPLLASPDFLEFLSENDLTGPLPLIPDASQMVAYAPRELASRSITAASPAAPPVIFQQAMPQQQIHPVTSICAAPVESQPALQFAGTFLKPEHGGAVAVEQHQQQYHQPQIHQQQQVPLQLQPSRTTSTVSSDASAGRAFAAPGSPVTSQPTPSCSDVSSLPVRNPRLSSGTSAPCSAADGPVTKRPRQQSGTLAAAPEQSRSNQEQKPLTKQQIAANKRRAPEVDWRSIEDPAERRRQRRLAKNRITAARSRERKKEQMAEMEERMSSLEQENAQMRALLANLTQENTNLKEQLASLTRGAAVFNAGSSPEPAVHKCLAIMHLVACLTLSVKTSFGLLLVLVSVLVQQGLLKGNSAASVSSTCCLKATAPAPSTCVVMGVTGDDEQLECLLSKAAASRPRLRHGCLLDRTRGVSSVWHIVASAA